MFSKKTVLFVSKSLEIHGVHKQSSLMVCLSCYFSISLLTYPVVILIVKNMMITPNTDSPLEQEVATQYSTNLSAFNKTAKEWTKKYASKK